MPALQLLRGMYNQKDEMVRKAETIIAKSYNSFTGKFGDLKFAVYNDKLVLTLDKSFNEDHAEHCDLWHATFTKDTIEIRRLTGVRYRTSSDTSDATVKITNDKIEGDVLTLNFSFSDTKLSQDDCEFLMEGFINTVNRATPFLQDLVQDINNGPHLHGLFKTNTKMPTPLVDIIKGYII